MFAPGLAAMGVLILASGFFSCSEAAFFSLDRRDRRKLGSGGQSAKMALRLLDDPDRLLTAILFWNLLVNLVFFAIVSMISLRFERAGQSAEAAGLTFGALLVIIVVSEMLPKTVAVLMPRVLASYLAVPLAASVASARSGDPGVAAGESSFAAVVLSELRGRALFAGR